MLRQKLVNLFSSHQKLIHEAEVLCQLLRSYSVPPRDVTRTLLQLGAKYKAILKHDRDVLQKQLPLIKDELIYEQARQVLTAINKLLNYKHLNSADTAALTNNPLPEAQHFNDTIRFMAERDLYTAEVRLYLRELKEDIASTRWKCATRIEYTGEKAYWRDGSFSSEEDDSDDRVYSVADDEYLKWEKTMPRPVADINCALADSEMKRDVSSVGVLAKYEEVKRHLAKLRKEAYLHPEASAFYRYHQDLIDSLSFVPLNQKAAAMTMKNKK